MVGSIRTRLIVLVCASGVLAGAIAWLGVNAVGSMHVRTQQALRVEARVAQTSAAIHAHVLGMRRYEKDAFLNLASSTKVAEYTQKFDEQHNALQGQFTALATLDLSSDDRARLSDMQRDEAAYLATFREVLRGIAVGEIATPAAANAALGPAKDHIRNLEKNAQDWGQAAAARMVALGAEIDAHANGTRQALIVFAVSGILVGLAAAFLLSRSILSPLENLRVRMSEVAKGDGDLTQLLPENRTDEFGAVAQAFNAFVRKMSAVIIDIRLASQQLRAAAEQLSDTSSAVSHSAQAQASALEEAAATIEEISSSVHQSSHHATQAQSASATSESAAVAGNEVIGKAVYAMAGISASSRQISQIVSTIDEIAFQTNLLALNAAVEAARAGEQGRSFAVVATEVRALAQRSAGAAREVRELIRDSEEKVQVGTALVSNSGATLDGIVGSAKRTGHLVGEMVGATAELSTAIEQVNQAISEIDRSVQSAAAQAEELTSTAHVLAEEAKHLDGLIAHFNVGDWKHTRAQTPPSPRVEYELQSQAA